MFKHTFSLLTFRKEKYIKINFTTTDSTQDHQDIWENSSISNWYNLLPIFVENKHSLHLETFKRMNKVQMLTPCLFCRTFQHLPQSNTFKRFINHLNGAIVFICTQARILRKSHLKDGLCKVFGIEKIYKTSGSQKIAAHKRKGSVCCRRKWWTSIAVWKVGTHWEKI